MDLKSIIFSMGQLNVYSLLMACQFLFKNKLIVPNAFPNCLSLNRRQLLLSVGLEYPPLSLMNPPVKGVFKIPIYVSDLVLNPRLHKPRKTL